MGLNVSKGNMYKFITHTWNTIKGQCYHDCTYCYMKRWGQLKPVRFDEKELQVNLGSGKFIFVGSSCDMFTDKSYASWAFKTLNHCKLYDNKYFFQSKNPINIPVLNLPENSVICTTIETNRFYSEIMKNSPLPENRAKGMEYLHSKNLPLYVTIEPVIDFDLMELAELVKRCRPLQVNIGADTGRHNLPEPSPAKLIELIELLGSFTIVKQKANLERLMKV